NAALLLSAGDRFVSVDDDQVCRVVDLAGGDAATVSSLRDPTLITAYASADARARHRWQKVDLLGAHEPFLGADAASAIRRHRRPGEATFEHASPTFLRGLLEGPRTIVATMTGYAGD